MNNVTTHLQIARWRLSHEIHIVHEFFDCDISNALEALGEPLCRTPFPSSTDYRPANYIDPMHPATWYTGGQS